MTKQETNMHPIYLGGPLDGAEDVNTLIEPIDDEWPLIPITYQICTEAVDVYHGYALAIMPEDFNAWRWVYGRSSPDYFPLVPQRKYFLAASRLEQEIRVSEVLENTMLRFGSTDELQSLYVHQRSMLDSVAWCAWAETSAWEMVR